MLTSHALNDFRQMIKKRIWKAQYKVSSTWYDITIAGIDILETGVVRVKVPISPGQACTIAGIRLISTDGDVWCEQSTSIVIEDAAISILQWFDFEITEDEE